MTVSFTARCVPTRSVLTRMYMPTRRWLHVDTGAYVSGSFTGPGRPEGGEALGLRALWRLLRERYGSGTAQE